MPRAQHIMTFAQTLQGGGVERAQLRLAAGWLAAGRRVTLVIGDSSGPLSAELPAGIDLIEIGSRRYMALFAAVPRYARALRPDILFCPGNHYTSAAAAASIALGRHGAPMIAKISNRLDRGDHRLLIAQGYGAWLKAHPWFIDHFVAMSTASKTEAMAAMGLPSSRVSVIANPPARHIPNAAPVALPATRFLLGVGRLVPQKRWDRLIRVMPMLRDASLRLVILGEGVERERLERLVSELGLGHRVTLPGHAADPIPAIERAEAVVLTSDFEGVPGVLREALAHGTPVVATDASVGVREVVHAPALGTVVPVDDPAALATALEHWLVPGRARPAPVPPPGEHAPLDYLRVMDRLCLRHFEVGGLALSNGR